MMTNEAILQLDNETYEQIKMILEYYGWDRQQKKACEALAELLAEILHHDPFDRLESKDVYKSITSKVADVCIMLEQIVKVKLCSAKYRPSSGCNLAVASQD